MPALLAVLIASAILSAAPLAEGRDLFVSNTAGDDIFDASAPTSLGDFRGPTRTITRALELAAAGDRIIMANTGVPYRESISLVASRHSGDGSRPFVIEGNGAVLEGLADVPYDYIELYRPEVFRLRPRRLGPQQFFINGQPAVRREADDSTQRVPPLEPLQWCLHRGYLYFRVEPGRMLGDYDVAVGAVQTGVTLYKVRDVLVRNLVIQGFQTDGLQADDSDGVLVAGVTCQANGRAGIAVVGASRVELAGCLCRDNGEAQLLVEYPAGVLARQLELIPGPGPPILNEGGILELLEPRASRDHSGLSRRRLSHFSSAALRR